MKATESPTLSNRLVRLEKTYKKLIERAYNLRQSDDSLSDFFYFKAEKMLKKMKALKNKMMSSRKDILSQN